MRSLIAVVLVAAVALSGARADAGPRSAGSAALTAVTQRVYFDITIDNQPAGRIVLYVTPPLCVCTH